MIYPDISLRDIERLARFEFLPFDLGDGINKLARANRAALSVSD